MSQWGIDYAAIREGVAARLLSFPRKAATPLVFLAVMLVYY